MLRFLRTRRADRSARDPLAPKRSFRAFHRSEDGQAIAELALALPVLLLVVLGIVDFGRAVNYWNDENHVANLGARLAAVASWPTSCEEGTKKLETPTLVAYLKCQAYNDSPELISGGGSTGVQNGIAVCVSFPTKKEEVGQPVTVSVTANYAWLPFFKFAEPTTKLTGTATMRLEHIVPNSELTRGSSC
jgi:Flp pilus assembly protein TadG